MTDTASTVLHASSGLTVAIPAGAVSGDGTLTATKTIEEGVSGWSIKLTGAKLTGKATLTFAGSPVPGEPAPLVGYTENPDSPLTPVQGVSLTSEGAKVTTTHFSFWFVDWWSNIKKGIAAVWGKIFSPDASGSKPTCHGEGAIRTAGYSVSSSSDDRVYWCMGDGGPEKRPQLTVVNARGYPIAVHETANMVLTNPDNSWQSLLPQLFAVLGQPKLPAGDSMHLLSGNASYTYNDTGDNAQGLQFTENGAAYIASALMYGVETVTMLGSIFGAKPVKAVLTAFDDVGCISGFKKMATAEVNSAGSAAKYLTDAVDTVSKCLGKVIEDVYKDGVIVSVLLQGAAWITSGFEDVVNGGRAVVDIFAHPEPYTITITQPARPAVTASDLMSITAPAMCRRPAEQLVNGELQSADPLMNGYTWIQGLGQGQQPLYTTGTTSSHPSGLAAVVFGCIATGGTVGWPNVIGLYNRSLDLIGAIDLGAIDQQEHSNVQTLAFTNGVLHVTWMTNDSCHTGADETVPRSADFTINSNGQATISHSVTGTSDQPCDN
ncbi:hypothetical protein [Parafrigoribacterium mesophilum]|uniref:hypothetical protein n=1 Tax=Parafrigoribacterium mesophilum TaxID=433646 RepID=UPI0031FD0866